MARILVIVVALEDRYSSKVQSVSPCPGGIKAVLYVEVRYTTLVVFQEPRHGLQTDGGFAVALWPGNVIDLANAPTATQGPVNSQGAR
jgi:hypothetical protein